jgi:dipeptidyl aminopeptidase/acylaminoacyl peptidase
MTASRDPDRLVAAFLDEGPIELSDRVVDSVLGEIHRTRQRAVFGSWRTLSMTRISLAAIVIVVAVSMGGLALWATRPSVPSIAASPQAPVVSPSLPIASATPRATQSAVGTILYGRWDAVSGEDHLYAIAPDGSAAWTLETKASCCLTVTPDGRTVVYGLTSSDGYRVPASRYLPAGDGFSLFDSPVHLNLRPGAVSSTLDIAFAGSDPKDSKRSGIYVSIANGGGLIWGTLKRLTTSPGQLLDLPLAFSPDGSTLLFERFASGSELGDLYVIRLDGSGLRKLNPASAVVRNDDLFGSGASWSPDGKRVAYSAFDPKGNACDSTGIFVINVADSTAEAIAHPNGCATSARWSPDGNWIAFDRGTNGDGGHDTWLLHPDGSGLVNATSSISVGVCCAQWSPDSSRLLIQGGDAAKAEVDLWIVNADGSGPAQLTSEPSLYKWYVWSPAR